MEYRKIVEVGTTTGDGVEFLDENKERVGIAVCDPPELAFALCMILGRDPEALDRIAMFCSAQDRR